jgi:hypothetical protein
MEAWSAGFPLGHGIGRGRDCFEATGGKYANLGQRFPAPPLYLQMNMVAVVVWRICVAS